MIDEQKRRIEELEGERAVLLDLASQVDMVLEQGITLKQQRDEHAKALVEAEWRGTVDECRDVASYVKCCPWCAAKFPDDEHHPACQVLKAKQHLAEDGQ